MAVEIQQIEFKEVWRDDYLKWICGFANTDGDQLYIGIDDKGNVSSLSNVKKLMEDITNKIASVLGIITGVNLSNKDKKQYISIVVPTIRVLVAYHGKYYLRFRTTLCELTLES
jgi:ATP-dependent DNA helicase RecG